MPKRDLEAVTIDEAIQFLNETHNGVRFHINPDHTIGYTDEHLFKSEAVKRARLSFEEIYMDFALGIARRSTCSRRAVGTVITTIDYRKVISVGYNGNATGLPNQCDHPEKVGGCGCLHSEENAIINCDAPRSVLKNIFCTVLPCPMCAKRIINLGGVVCVFYRDEYRLEESAKIFEIAKIKLERI